MKICRRCDQELFELFGKWLHEETGLEKCSTQEIGRCELHPAYEADYCPRCGTATIIPRAKKDLACET